MGRMWGMKANEASMTSFKVWGRRSGWMLFIFIATLNTERNRFDGGEGVEIKSWIPDVLIFPGLFGI